MVSAMVASREHSNTPRSMRWIEDFGRVVFRHRTLRAFLWAFPENEWAEVMAQSALLGLQALVLVYGGDRLRAIDVHTLRTLVENVEKRGSWPANLPGMSNAGAGVRVKSVDRLSGRRVARGPRRNSLGQRRNSSGARNGAVRSASKGSTGSNASKRSLLVDIAVPRLSRAESLETELWGVLGDRASHASSTPRSPRSPSSARQLATVASSLRTRADSPQRGSGVSGYDDHDPALDIEQWRGNLRDRVDKLRHSTSFSKLNGVGSEMSYMDSPLQHSRTAHAVGSLHGALAAPESSALTKSRDRFVSWETISDKLPSPRNQRANSEADYYPRGAAMSEDTIASGNGPEHASWSSRQRLVSMTSTVDSEQARSAHARQLLTSAGDRPMMWDLRSRQERRHMHSLESTERSRMRLQSFDDEQLALGR